ncbi:MAG: cation:proton antiporter [Treponema sp.]|nr:cation:proton antiporter [Treponema sp.]
MLFTVALILLSGMAAGFLCKKIRFPALFGMILMGIVLGPHVFNLLDDSILNISTQIRKIALIIILIRAGLKLNLSDLKKNGRSAVLMCFVPATLEMTGMILVAPAILGISRLDAAIMGAVVAAVSPAVVVPKMIKLIDENRGTQKGIPQMILAGASVDDVFVIVMFSTFTSLAKGDGISLWKIAGIPLSIITGIGIGYLTGIALNLFWKKIHIRDTSKLIVLLCSSLLMVTVEDKFSGIVPFASLIGVMISGLAVKMKNEETAKRLSSRFDKIWVVAEIFLFVLVGACVEITSAADAGIKVIAVLAAVMVFRMAGVFICVLGTNLNFRERLFCALAYMPKATVQAAIGGLPLAMGLECGNIVLTVSVLAILITAPLGAFAIDLTYKKFLSD